MRPQDFQPGYPGTLVDIAPGVTAFTPHPLPPVLEYGPELTRAVATAQEAVGRLDEALPKAGMVDPYLLVNPLILREAYYSSLIEGTYTTPKQLALFPREDPGKGESPEDTDGGQTREVLNYANALRNGIAWVREQGRSLEHSAILELHRRLLEGVRGDEGRPGAYRDRQNFVGTASGGIGNARYVPPPPLEVRPLMDGLVEFLGKGIGRDADLPWPVAIALLHYQFEAIHPFEDGNGRIGRLLIPLVLIEKGIMKEPILHVSSVVEGRKEEYRDRLLRVSLRGEWREWLLFFLGTLRDAATESRARIASLLALRESYLARIRGPRASILLTTLVEGLFLRPATTFNEARDLTGVTHAQAAAHVRRLESLGILERVDDSRRNIRYVAGEILRTTFE